MQPIRALLEVHGKPPKEVYFDLENSGWMPPEVVEYMLPYFNRVGYGHPAVTNKPGWEAYGAVYEAKELIAKTVNASSPDELVITHSGTEANNLAVMGVALANRERRGKVVVSAIEHLSVIFPAEEASRLFGFRIVRVPVDGHGFVDPDVLSACVDRDTVLVSVQAVNHEIGTIQDIGRLSKAVKEANPDALLHVDAADAYGRIPIDVKSMNIDLMTISSHKVLGPRGIGVLYVREGVRIEPVVRGQLSTERLWPGVENVPLIMGFKKAVELAFTDFEAKVSYVRMLRDKLLNGVLREVPHVLVNGPLGDKRAPDNANVSFLYVEGEALTVELSLRGVYVSSGSACTSRVLEPSHVLLAIGRRYEEAHGSILFKLMRYHSIDDVDYTLEQIPKAVSRLRSISALKHQ